MDVHVVAASNETKMNSIIGLPGNACLSLTLRDGQAEAHIWAGRDFEESDVLTGAGFYRIMSLVKKAIVDSGATSLLIAACDDRRQKVFDYYAKKCGGQQVAGIDPDGDPCLVWVF